MAAAPSQTVPPSRPGRRLWRRLTLWVLLLAACLALAIFCWRWAENAAIERLRLSGAQRLDGYALLIAALMSWLLIWGHIRRDTLAASGHQSQPAALPAEEHARALGLRPEDVLAWQAERSLIANFTPEGAIVSMDPWSGDQRQ